MGHIPRILVVGSLNMDLVISLPVMPAAGETLFGTSYSYIPGGKGANQAIAAARLGGKVSFAGRVGGDSSGQTLLRGLQKDGVDTTHIVTDPDCSTGLAVIPVEQSGQNRIIVLSGANMRVEKSDLAAAFSGEYDAVITQLEVPLEIVYETCRYARERNIPMILDAGPSMKLDLSRLAGIAIISPNESETEAITGICVSDEKSVVKAAEKIARESDAKYVVLKLGARGAFLYGKDRTAWFPAFNGLPVEDTTAAGDAFTAAMTVEYLKSGDIDSAIRFANAAGALCVSRRGAQPSLPYLEETGRLLPAVD